MTKLAITTALISTLLASTSYSAPQVYFRAKPAVLGIAGGGSQTPAFKFSVSTPVISQINRYLGWITISFDITNQGNTAASFVAVTGASRKPCEIELAPAASGTCLFDGSYMVDSFGTRQITTPFLVEAFELASGGALTNKFDVISWEAPQGGFPVGLLNATSLTPEPVIDGVFKAQWRVENPESTGRDLVDADMRISIERVTSAGPQIYANYALACPNIIALGTSAVCEAEFPIGTSLGSWIAGDPSATYVVNPRIFGAEDYAHPTGWGLGSSIINPTDFMIGS